MPTVKPVIFLLLLALAALCGQGLLWLAGTALPPVALAAPLLLAALCVVAAAVLLVRLWRRAEAEHAARARAVASLAGSRAETLSTEDIISGVRRQVQTLRKESKLLKTSTRVLAFQKSNAESILRSLPEGILVMETTGQVTFVNQQFLRWYQLTSEDVMGKLPQEWCTRHELTAFLKRFCGTLARRSEKAPLDREPPGKPGAVLSAVAYPMFSARDEGTINNTLVVFSDVTSEVSAQASRDEFAAALAHELKTPLHAIGLQAEMLMDLEELDQATCVEAANFIQEEVDHVSDLVRNMLNITRIESGSLSINRKLTKFADLVNNAIENLESMAAEQQVVIQRHMPDAMEASYLDKDLLRVAVNNFLSNAIKYNKPGGEVRVSLSETDAQITMVVEDTGIGIPEADRARIFEKFYRSDDATVRARPGHGLGLSLAREIIELHNGTISVESEAGKGTRFTVRLKRMNIPLQEAA